MPILNLSNPAFISVDGAGRPNSSGTVEVYVADGLFTTEATIYADQVKTTELTNPVTMDSAGTKEIWYDVKVDIREKTSTGALIRDTLNLDPNASQASVQGFNLAQNGSFEIDSTSDGQPDNWTISPYSGSAIAITNDVVTDGVEALEFNTTGAGSGGGTATSAKFPVTEGSIVSVAFSFYATHATTLNTFVINWYDEDGVVSGSPTTVTMPASGAVPTSWTTYQEDVTATAGATQGEIVLTGITSSGSNLSSKAYFDGIKITNAGLATLNTTQTLTNKTLTSPTLNTPTINGADIDITTFGGGAITEGTEVATTSGTEVEFTSIPSWVKRITLMYEGTSHDGTSLHTLVIGDASSYEVTGYVNYISVVSTAATNVIAATTRFDTTGAPNATGVVHGAVTLTLKDAANNTWAITGATSYFNAASANEVAVTAGTKTLTGVLTRIKLGSASADTYDAGSVNILYEG